jgi:hypothetical protein
MSLYEDEDVDKHMNGAVEEKVRPHSGRNLRYRRVVLDVACLASGLPEDGST